VSKVIITPQTAAIENSFLIMIMRRIYGIYASSILLISFGVGLYKVISKFVPSLPTKDEMRSSNL
jgi:hypothetical protein